MGIRFRAVDGLVMAVCVSDGSDTDSGEARQALPAGECLTSREDHGRCQTVNHTVRIDPGFLDTGALEVLKRLRAAGYTAYFVGGGVRDALLGRKPKDWDIATSACPEEIEALFPKTIPVGRAFGVVIVLTSRGHCEVATFRGDGTYTDGRRPESVRFTSAEEDVRRRDFTINALLYDPDAEVVLDYVDGLGDLSRRILRTVGDPVRRFSEDHLRLLRAVRFTACTGFCLEPGTRDAILSGAAMICDVSPERIAQELVRMLTEGYSRCAFELLLSTGLLVNILPEAAAMAGCPQPHEFHPEGDVWSHVCLMLELWDRLQGHGCKVPERLPDEVVKELKHFPDDEREALAWAILLHDVGKPGTVRYEDRIRFHGHDRLGAQLTGEILRRLRRPTRIVERAVEVVSSHMHFMHIRDMREATRRRFVRQPAFISHLVLHFLDCRGSHGGLESFQRAFEAWEYEQHVQEPLKPLLTGHDLINMGYHPGPVMGDILRQLEDARLEGDIHDAVSARDWVLRRFPLDQSQFPDAGVVAAGRSGCDRDDR